MCTHIHINNSDINIQSLSQIINTGLKILRISKILLLISTSSKTTLRKLKHLSNENMFGDAYDAYSLIFLLPVNYVACQKPSDLIKQLHSGIHYFKTVTC